MRRLLALALVLGLSLSAPLWATPKSSTPKKSDQPEEKKELPIRLKPETYGGLSFRSIGPGVTSGRIADLKVHPKDKFTWYVIAASGNAWKTTNAGTTWTPIFDGYGSYSLGTVTIDPNDPLTVWIGSGENNSQRSVGYGDGVYVSHDGGKSFEKSGLERSEHIGMIAIDPRDSRTVFVAAMGPLWASGGDRGLYKTTDGGKTWTRILHVDDDTGVSEVLLDPRRPDTLYAVSYQRRRHVWTLINGGPGSAIHKSTDGGATWKKIVNGLPSGDLGRIGIAIAPSRPDTLYAIVEAERGEGGLYRSLDGGSSWDKRNAYAVSSAQYYSELFVDPKNAERIYIMDTLLGRSEDGGKTVASIEGKYKHVDNHAMWIDPDNTAHMLVGCDGGLYETWDDTATWDFKSNMSLMQLYRVAVDDSKPFYYIYGGTQDNLTWGGPSRTRNLHGGRNSDWFTVTGGDGFEPAIDPSDPNIVYAESQYGGLVRFDRRSGEEVELQPQPGAGEAPLRWNWDSPLIISPHRATRLYYAAQRVFKSDDRGDTWVPISADLTRQLDRNKLPVMGRVWGIDAIAKNASTSFYGNIVSLAESPKVAGLIYVGTDDGLIQVSEDDGKNWRKLDTFPGVPDRTYVTDLYPSSHDADTVYATFGNHKLADFKPYVLKSSDRGRTWTSIANGLPERGNVWTIAEDLKKRGLLYLGTEFGFFVSSDDGKGWLQLKGGLPTTAIRDIELQPTWDDLVLASFGRGFYILDDMSPLRWVDDATVAQEAALLPVREAVAYIQDAPLGGNGKSFQGDSLFTAPNPPFGATFTYYLKDEIKTKKAQRKEREKKLVEEKKDVPYPSWDEVRAEEREEAPSVVLTVRSEDGKVVRRITGPVGAGLHRVTWDLRYPPSLSAQSIVANDEGALPSGPLAVPGNYTVSLQKRVDGQLSALAAAQSFRVTSLDLATLGAQDKAARLAFERQLGALQRAVLGAGDALDEARGKLTLIKRALGETPDAPDALGVEARRLETVLADLEIELRGDSVVAARNEPTSPSITDRVVRAVYSLLNSTAAPTQTQRKAYDLASDAFKPVLAKLQRVVETDLDKLDAELEKLGAPHTPGRVPHY
ncbi:MAG: glycosyl hydrolase [Acidobacteriota bacterium]